MNKTFILGNPRSGTSLLRLMLNANSAIISPPECGFLHWWSKKYLTTNFTDINTVTQFIEDLKTSKKIEGWNLDFKQLEDFLSSKLPLTYSKLTELVYVFYALNKKDIKHIVDKNNYYINHLAEIKNIWPEASFIQLVRDGRDVACSYKDLKNMVSDSPYKPKLSDQIVDIANEWTINNTNINNFINQPDVKGYSLRYEDLICNTKVELEKLCSFLEVHYDPMMLEYYKLTSHDEPQETMDWKKKTLTPPDTENVGRFINILSAEEVSTFNLIAEKVLLKFNYKI
jgi:hypothetical protein